MASARAPTQLWSALRHLTTSHTRAPYQHHRWYNSYKGAAAAGDAYVVDVRSDVLTQPTDAMRRAMSAATAGDDVFREDPTVQELEEKCAAIFGMQSSLFVPSGTMGNLLAVLCHCDGRGLEALFGHTAHLVVYEQGGMAQLGGVMPRTIPNKPDGTFDLAEMEDYIRPTDDPHEPITSLVCVENTHGNCGGKVLPLDFLAKLRARTNELGLPVHMDGARVMNAAVALGVDPREILQHVDSVSVCLSKGVGAPIGSIVAGRRDFVDKTIRLRKALGGGWRKPGPLAAAGLVALQDYRERLAIDHQHAKMFAKGVMKKKQQVLHIDLEGVHSNIVFVNVVKPGLTAQQFSDRLENVTEEEAKSCGQRVQVRSLPFYKYATRIIFCHNNSTEDVQRLLNKVHYVIDEQTD